MALGGNGTMKAKARSSATCKWRMTIVEEAEAVLRELTPREEAILRRRFGIGNRQPEIEDAVVRPSLTPAIVRRIERVALRKLRLTAVKDAHSQRAPAR
jgi:RNA polymerase primary sigma factor